MSIVALADTQSIADVTTSQPQNIAIVLLRTRYISSVTHRPKACPECIIPLFFDVTRTVRDLVRALHMQALYSHGSRSQPSRCTMRRDTSACFFADSSSGNPLLPLTVQSTIVDPSVNVGRSEQPLTKTADGSHAIPNGDGLYDVPVVELLRQKYLRSTSFARCASSTTSTRPDTHRAAKESHHLPPMCRRVLAEQQQQPPDLECECGCETDEYGCACAACSRTRVAACFRVHTRCTTLPRCTCLLDKMMSRTALVLRLDAVSGVYDETSEMYGERVFDIESPTVQRYVARLTHRDYVLKRYEAYRADAVITLLAPDERVSRSVAFRDYEYDFVLARLGLESTICANLVAVRQFDQISVLKDAMVWVGTPARHFLQAAMTDFKTHKERLYETYRVSGGTLLSRFCERAVYNELRREPNRALALNRVLAFEPHSPTMGANRECYTMKQHDDVVLYVMCLVHLVAAAESAVAEHPAPINDPACDDPLRRMRFLIAAVRDAEAKDFALFE